MQAADLSKYISDPSAMGPEAVDDLGRLVTEFPYFQPAHLLLSLAAHRYDAAVYQRTLKKTAIVVTNRTRLFELINAQAERAQPMPKQVSPSKEAAGSAANDDLTLLKIAENDSEKPLAPVKPQTAVKKDPEEELEKEIGRQVVTALVEKTILKEPETPAAPKAEPATFGDWLSYLKKNNGQPYSDIEEQVKRGKQEPVPEQKPAPDRRQKNQAIINSIIEKNPGHIRVKDEKFFSPETSAKESLLDNEHLVTETLARIYALQGNTGKAIRAYQILSLKNPQKSAYFAGLIEKLRNNDKTK